MIYNELGKTGIRISKICFGSLTLGPLCANLDLSTGTALLVDAFRRGINFVDSAELYQTYPYIRSALNQIEAPERIIVAGKTFVYSDIEASWAIEEMRIELRRETLDIFLLHEVRDTKDFFEREDVWRVLREAKANGIIKAIGLSTHSAEVAAWAAEVADVDIIHPMLNMDGIGILDGGTLNMLAAIAKAKQNGKGVYTMKAIGGGALMHKAQAALKWAFDQSYVDSIAVGFKDKSELATNIGWLLGYDPPEAKKVLLLDRNIVFDKEPKCHGCGNCVRRCANEAMVLDANGQAVWQKANCLYCGYCIAACPWFCLSFC